MKINCCIYFSLAFTSLLIYAACGKIIRPDDSQNGRNPIYPPNTTDSTNSEKSQGTDSTFTRNSLLVNSTTCAGAPNYGDSIVYLKPNNNQDYFVSPVNNIGVDGTYLSWPEGLKLNRTNGAINLSQSETGVRYNIAFIRKGAKDTCVSQLIVGGLTYMDAIYIPDQGDTLAIPVFNADPFGLPICDGGNDSEYPDNNENVKTKCVFDNNSPGKRANMFNYKIIKGKPRPPLIIIAGFKK